MGSRDGPCDLKRWRCDVTAAQEVGVGVEGTNALPGQLQNWSWYD